MTERDPDGLTPDTPGAKLDDGKPEMELVFRGFSRALRAVAEVGTYGARKYSRDGWERVQDGARRYTNAMYRHLNDEHSGEMNDPHTQLPHAAHAAWNALARLELMMRDEVVRRGLLCRDYAAILREAGMESIKPGEVTYDP